MMEIEKICAAAGIGIDVAELLVAEGITASFVASSVEHFKKARWRGATPDNGLLGFLGGTVGIRKAREFLAKPGVRKFTDGAENSTSTAATKSSAAMWSDVVAKLNAENGFL